MKKFVIVEIENSYLNFFTPAVMLAVGYFLFYLFVHPLALIYWYASQLDMRSEIVINLAAITETFSTILVCLAAFFIFIPHLKVKDSEFKSINFVSISIFFVILCLALSLRLLVTLFFDFLGTKFETGLAPWFINSYSQFSDPVFLFLFIFYEVIMIPIFIELIYRRVIIPLLEDRGASPLLAVLLAAFGYFLIHLPYFIEHWDNPLSNAFWIISTLLYGIATGLLYILTRNIFFPIIYSICYSFYKLLLDLSLFFNNELLLFLFDIFHIFLIIFGILLIIYIIREVMVNKTDLDWIKVITFPSAPRILRGIIGFLLISITLVIVQVMIPEINDAILPTNVPLKLLLYSVFYLIAFSIPFWLTITTEYAQSKI